MGTIESSTNGAYTGRVHLKETISETPQPQAAEPLERRQALQHQDPPHQGGEPPRPQPRRLEALVEDLGDLIWEWLCRLVKAIADAVADFFKPHA